MILWRKQTFLSWRMFIFDEQYYRMGRTQKYRLTLPDSVTGRPTADELFNKKDPETIKVFLARYLNPDKRTFVVTGLYPSYPDVLQEFFGNKLVRKLCLLHLNKSIVNDFPRKTAVKQGLTKYRLLNIFYNREAEIKILKNMAREEDEQIKENDMKKSFNKFLYQQKLERRHQTQNLEQMPYFEALEVFNELMEEIDSFDLHVQKRLRMIEKNWEKFTAFYFIEGAPATSSSLKNYYSTNLKTHRKKQEPTEEYRTI